MSNEPVYQPATDDEYHSWRRGHRQGWVVNLPKLPSATGAMLHRATCSHISTHNNDGAFTEHESANLCFATYGALRNWRQTIEAAGLRLCKRCKVR